jgi:hypothetical protein
MSLPYALERETTILRQTGDRIAGRVMRRDLRTGHGTLWRETSCGSRRKVATVRIGRDGRFRARATRPSSGFAVYRLRVRLSRSTVSWSDPLFVLPEA